MKSTLLLLAFALLAFPLTGMAQEPKAAEPELPAALANLSFVREEAVKWYVEFNMKDEGKWKPWIIGMNADKTRFENNSNPKAWLTPGDTFFKEGPMAGRFKFVGFGDEQVKSRTGWMEPRTVAEYEDKQANKRGTKYRSLQGLPSSEMDTHAYYDRTAVFAFKTAGKVLQTELKVEELTHFSLPPDAPNKDLFLKEVSAEKVVVEYKDPSGALRSTTIPKTPENKAESANYYQRLDLPKDAQGMDILKQLALLKLTPKGVDGQSLGEVLRLLNQAGAGGEDGAVINFVIRGHSDDAPKVTLPEKETNFAAALDAACKQAGFRWKIEFKEDSKQPLLVIYPRTAKR